ncbi:MAG: hypothetical protein ACMXYG_05845 [Candidatus Woesearchaeota archaeon]
MDENKLLYYITQLKHYLFLFIPILLLIALSFLGVTRYDTKTAFDITNAAISNYWIEILIITFILSIAIWLFGQHTSARSIKKLKIEAEERKRKADVHNMRFSVHKD